MINESDSLSRCVDEYCQAVAQARLPRAYRGILSSLSLFQTVWKTTHPADAIGALYQGYLDMSFVAFTPVEFAHLRLKISLVFLHATGTFSLWLAAGNRAIQKRVSQMLRKVSLGQYELCDLEPGVDAIISIDIPKPYPFDDPDGLNRLLVAAAEMFTSDMISIVQQKL